MCACGACVLWPSVSKIALLASTIRQRVQLLASKLSHGIGQCCSCGCGGWPAWGYIAWSPCAVASRVSAALLLPPAPCRYDPDADAVVLTLVPAPPGLVKVRCRMRVQARALAGTRCMLLCRVLALHCQHQSSAHRALPLMQYEPRCTVVAWHLRLVLGPIRAWRSTQPATVQRNPSPHNAAVAEHSVRCMWPAAGKGASICRRAHRHQGSDSGWRPAGAPRPRHAQGHLQQVEPRHHPQALLAGHRQGAL